MILSCSGTLGTCCTDGGMVVLVDMTKRVFDIIQIVVPIILIIWATWGFVQLVMDPEAKNGTKKIMNRFIAAIVVFLLPAFVSFMLGLMPETFSLGACWKQSKNKAEVARQNSTYKNPYGDDNKTTPIYPDPSKYDSGDGSSASASASTPGSSYSYAGTDVEQAVVAYAKSFVGGKYCKGGVDPHKCADCTGFARYVLNHFNGSGKKIGSTGLPNKSDPHPETFIEVSAKDLRGGDIIAYPHHFAIATGNGKEIVHAANRKDGIIISKSYKMGKIDGFYRFKYLTLK